MLSLFHKKKKVLIVEDHVSLRKALTLGLEPLGVTILEASNGKQGLEMIHKESPDLVLLDLMMPIMDGISLLKALREKNPDTAHPHVLVITNSNNEELIQEGMNLGIAGYILKSDWNMEQMVEMIKKWL